MYRNICIVGRGSVVTDWIKFINYRLDTIISEMKIKNLYDRATENYISSMKIKYLN